MRIREVNFGNIDVTKLTKEMVDEYIKQFAAQLIRLNMPFPIHSH